MPWLGRRPPREAALARIAGCIPDPVLRLRFLRITAPRLSVAQRLAHGLLRGWFLWVALALALLIPLLVKRAAGNAEPKPHPIALHPAVAGAATESGPVWLVEQTGDSEVYSNGLRIDTRYTISTTPRSYIAFSRSVFNSWTVRAQPAGIVYHTTESCQAPFEADATPALKRIGESLLEYVRRRRAYHYLIDRFGRVYRIAPESGAAGHAGYSVWADDHWFYVNLNNSFIGVAFEAQSSSGQVEGVASPAQVRAAAMLTEMLRSRYGIPAGNCVTHAQVSVNPDSMLLGYHTDWAAGFPFQALGLPDNYRIPLPALWAFGFACEPAWVRAASQMTAGVDLAQQELMRRAAAGGMPAEAYRKKLRQQYHVWLAQVRRPR